MKTKTLVNTLTSLRVIPQQPDDFGGENLSEAILVRNILEEMFSSALTLQLLVDKLGSEDTIEFGEMDDDLQKSLGLLKEAIDSLKDESNFPQSDQESYDADTEVFDERVYFSSSKRRRQNRKEKGPRRSRGLSSGTSGVLRPSEERFINAARDLLLLAQNDRKTAQKLKQILANKFQEEEMKQPEYLTTLKQFHKSSISRIMVPQVTYVQEIESLCASVSLKIKFEKIVQRLKATLTEIETTRDESVTSKMAETKQLEESIHHIRESSHQVKIKNSNLGAFLNQMVNNM